MTNRRERRAAGKAAKQGWARTDASPPQASASLPVQALLAHALELYRSGKLAEAESAYRAILKRVPRDPDALYQFGILAGQTGRLMEAERCLGEAVGRRPREPQFHHALGLLRAAQGCAADALACHDKALALDAGHVGALAGRADALHEIGRLSDAEAAYRRASALAPLAPEIRFGWATVLTDLGRLEAAAQTYRDLLALGPSSAEAHVNLGTVLRDLGRLDEAMAELQAALRLKPGIAHALVELVRTLTALGRSEEAVHHAAQAMRRDSRSPEACRAFAVAVAGSGPLVYNPEIAGFLERCLSASDVEHDDLAKPSAGQLRQKHGIDPSPAEAARRIVDTETAENGTAGCLIDPLLLRLLAAAVNTDLQLEAFLTEVRRRLCLAQNLPARPSPARSVPRRTRIAGLQ